MGIIHQNPGGERIPPRANHVPLELILRLKPLLAYGLEGRAAKARMKHLNERIAQVESGQRGAWTHEDIEVLESLTGSKSQEGHKDLNWCDSCGKIYLISVKNPAIGRLEAGGDSKGGSKNARRECIDCRDARDVAIMVRMGKQMAARRKRGR